MTREEWLPGERAWFEYHCWESDESADAEIWYRSHQMVTIITLNEHDAGDMIRAERDKEGLPYTYRVGFDDGTEWDVWEDELSETVDEWYRPDPPSHRADTGKDE